MRDILIALLVLALGVWWFSAYGPGEPIRGRAESSWVMSGDGPEQVALAVPGAGVVAVTVARAGEPEEEPVQIQSTAQEHTAAPEIVEEVTGMEGVNLFLIGYAAGVAAVLIGMFAGWAVAWLYRKITR